MPRERKRERGIEHKKCKGCNGGHSARGQEKRREDNRDTVAGIVRAEGETQERCGSQRGRFSKGTPGRTATETQWMQGGTQRDTRREGTPWLRGERRDGHPRYTGRDEDATGDTREASRDNSGDKKGCRRDTRRDTRAPEGRREGHPRETGSDTEGTPGTEKGHKRDTVPCGGTRGDTEGRGLGRGTRGGTRPAKKGHFRGHFRPPRDIFGDRPWP